ncbi:MAG: terpene cyclase/mutase family protein [candidate division WOR-3 bacterium]|nr:terpene cyclase/mutase family protein [candidate division WOR-3 bacterium]
MARIRYDAVKYVKENGNAFDKLYLADALNQRPDKNLVEELLSLQNPDAGWSWQLQKNMPSGIVMTGRVLELLLKTGLDKNSNQARNAIDFLWKNQKPDGGWSENPELSAFIPKEHGWISTEHSMTWATGDAVNALIKAGYLNHPGVKKAVAFLLKSQNEEGGWYSHVGKNYPYGTDLASMDVIVKALLLSEENRESAVFKKTVEAILKYRAKWKSPVDAAAVLNIFLSLGYKPEHQSVRELVDILIKTQDQTGGWRPIETSPTDPAQTVYCLKQLKKCGVEIYRAPLDK